MNLQEASKELAINYQEAMTRFGGVEAIYQRFLKKFLNDSTYQELEEAWQKNEYQEIEKKAHTLKGVAGNLSLEKLYTISDSLVQKIRNEQYEETAEIYEELQKCYQHTVAIISKID